MTPERIALVTGASRGLGFATAAALGARGWQVIAFARTVGGLEELDDTIRKAGGPPATLVPADITDKAALPRMGLAIHQRWGRLDLLVHCAAHAPPLAPAPHIDDKDADRAMAVNGLGLQRLIVMADPLLRAAEAGRAVFCDDPVDGKFWGGYAASKAAGRAIARAYAAESVRTGPDIRLFVPPPMPTALRARFFPGENRDSLTAIDRAAEALLASLGLGRSAAEG
ncbi:MAG: SDR family NAD(P)-dependent oxidoreductase [Pseudomonadota bacterium]